MSGPSNVSALHDSLLTAIGSEIVSGTLPSGDVITLDGVSATHGVSRSVAREAIRVLESMGMVSSRRRVGITIQPAEQWNVFDPRVIRWRLDSGDRAAQLVSLSELRRGFEPAAAALAEDNLGYTVALGIPELREGIAASYGTRYGVAVEPEILRHRLISIRAAHRRPCLRVPSPWPPPAPCRWPSPTA